MDLSIQKLMIELRLIVVGGKAEAGDESL